MWWMMCLHLTLTLNVELYVVVSLNLFLCLWRRLCGGLRERCWWCWSRLLMRWRFGCRCWLRDRNLEGFDMPT